MEAELESFWKDKRKVKLEGTWYDLADHIDDKYIPKQGTVVSVTLTDNKVTFMTVEGEQKSRYYPAEDCDRPETLKEYHDLQAKRSTDFYNGKRVKLRGSTSENS